MAPLLEPPPPRPDAPEAEGEMTPEERAALVNQMDRVRQEKLEALREPGASWHEWFFFDAMKWWVILGFLIVDVWIYAWWVMGEPVAGPIALVAGIYLEFLAYRVLWYRPKEEGTVRRGSFHPTWTRPVQFGRWTPEAKIVRERGFLPGVDEGPSPKEFA